MKKYRLLLLALSIGLFTSCAAKQEPKTVSIVPKPQSLVVKSGKFKLNNQVSIIATRPEVASEANYLAKSIKQQTGLEIPVSKQMQSGNTILLKLNTGIQLLEGYQIHSSNDKFELEAATRDGLFYAIQSFLQLIPVNIQDDIPIPIVEIKDEPRFPWRGLHLDVCRHFYPVDYVKKVIDMAAMHKINVFHWHLTDDQGWRIEIKKYPRLTEIGAWRNETKVGHMADFPDQFDGVKHGGFYTQEQIKEVVAYAQSRHITIVPEIEMPGHAQAAIAAYPELGCFNQNLDVMKVWGVSNNVFCAGKESTFGFMEDVLSEVIELFPGKYIHIGGDECPKKSWESCQVCQKRIADEGLKNEHELQSYFIQRIEHFLSSKDKKLIGWDEILEGGLAEGAAVMSWRGEKGGIEAANMRHEVVMTPTGWCYFDFYQSSETTEPLAIAGLTDLEKVYGYNPIPKDLVPEKQKYILGTQANLWTEYIATEDKVEYMLFPRLCALSEVQWTNPEVKNYKDFLSRMDAHYLRLSKNNFNYRVPTPQGLFPIQIYNDNYAIIKLKNSVPSADIRYTLDGTEPNLESERYNLPFQVFLDSDVNLKAATFLSNGVKSATVSTILKHRNYKTTSLKRPQPGLDLTYYDGPFKTFKEIKGEPLLTQKANWLVVPHNTMKDLKGWIFEGYMQIKEHGTYLFELSSSCGSGLYIGNELVIDNDGLFYTKNKPAQIELQAGFYPITVKYFNSKYGQFVRLYCQKPGSDEMEVFPGEQYFRKISE
ncbi:family 20 glycosylhydrolase [Sunxiuqinia sp. A32]|uniref:family 20 glycosylhydrolase n=1 Tax=Sunxiuqinia sp. A32 TaxID=3461496 RepID=UPI00404545B7